MMKPLLGMSVGMVICVVKQGQFWSKLLRKQQRVSHDVLEAARSDLSKAAEIARQAQTLPVGRFLLAPLKLESTTPETFRLALEAAADQEFVQMRKGNRQLELIATVSPLFGLLGAAIAGLGLFGNPNLANASSINPQNITKFIYQAMIPVATSLNVEIIALTALSIFKNLQSRQAEYFSEVGTKLELFYREFWQAAQRQEREQALHNSKISGRF